MRRTVAVPVFVLLAAALACNVLQALRIASLERQAAGASFVNSANIGRQLVTVTARDHSGKLVAVPLRDPNRDTVVYVFRPSCMWCARNEKSLAVLESQSGARYRVVGLSLESENLQSFLDTNRMKMPVYSEPDAVSVSELQLGVTPETLVVSPAGRIERDWRGAYTSGARELIEGYFRLALPHI